MSATKDPEPTLQEQAQRARERATPYGIAREVAMQAMTPTGLKWKLALQLWNTERAVTVVGGKPRFTKEGHETNQPYARTMLGHLVSALADPDRADVDFLLQYRSIAPAIFALKPEDRDKLRNVYQEVLDEYDAQQQ